MTAKTINMGNMFTRRQEQEVVVELVNQSGGTIAEENVYDIMMKSNSKELLTIFQMFNELDVDTRVIITQGFLSNKDFLGMDEFRFHPFRFRLKYALQMKNDDHIHSIQRNAARKEQGSRSANTPESRNAANSSNAGSGKVAPIDESDDRIFTDIDKVPYIDFSLFCVYLTPFCQRTPIDIKVSFLFRLFDIDEDGTINRHDLTEALNKMLANSLLPKEIEETVDVIFEEVGGNKEGLDKEDFQKVLWVTDFDQKLNIARISG